MKMLSKLAWPMNSSGQAAHKGRAPGPLLMLMEARAPWEAAALAMASPWLNRLPAGDGHPVLVLPGLAASDLSTTPLRRFLHRRGHSAHAWKQGFNFGPRHGVLQACRGRLRHLADRHGRKVSLIGWSLGGVYARELAKQLEPQTRCVVTLGSPFSGHVRGNNVARAFELFSGSTIAHDPERAARLRRSPPVPTTSIYSRSDGVVAWQCSLNDDEPHTENIEIPSSHLGLGVNPLALYALADRLRQDPAHWQRFDPHPAQRWWFRGTSQGHTKAAH
jgi:pimeloyl-ACP methyl ester carboxylesterase